MKSLSVLLVDDDTDFAEGLGDLIRFYGHSVAHAPNADAAMEMASSTQYDLIFLDLRMPGLSGLDVYPRLREISPQACIVFATAFMGDIDRRSNRQVMHADLLEKPSGISRLDKVLRRVAGEFEVLLVGPEADVRDLHQALRHRGYQVLRAEDLDAAAEIVTSSVGEKVSAVVGPFRLGGQALDELDARLDEFGMALPLISVGDPAGTDRPAAKAPRVQRLSSAATLADVLESVDRGAELFVV
ncbi:MAG: response regulator [Pseudomonadota bacterium]